MGPMEGSIVLRPADGPLEMVLGCIGVEPTAAVGPLQGGWWFTFGADADRPWGAAVADVAATDRITALRIVGLAPAALRGVVVRHGETLLFEMESHVGTTGHVSTAGEILHAMGLYRAGCGEGLMVDLLPAVDACTWRALRVRLAVRASDRPDDPSARRPCPAIRVSLVAGGHAAARPRPPR